MQIKSVLRTPRQARRPLAFLSLCARTLRDRPWPAPPAFRRTYLPICA